MGIIFKAEKLAKMIDETPINVIDSSNQIKTINKDLEFEKQGGQEAPAIEMKKLFLEMKKYRDFLEEIVSHVPPQHNQRVAERTWKHLKRNKPSKNLFQ